MTEFLRILPAFTAMLSAMLGGVVLLPRSRTRQHVFFGLLNLGVFLWSMAFFLGLTAPLATYSAEHARRFAFAMFAMGQLGIALATTYWLLFALETTGLTDWTHGRRLAALHLPGIALVLATATNPLHRSFVTFIEPGRPQALRYGVLAVPILLGVYGLIASSILVYLRARPRTENPLLRRPYAILAWAAVLPLVTNVAWFLRGSIGFSAPYNPTVLVLALTNVLVGFGIFRAGLMDIVPAAEGQAFRATHDAGIVLGPDRRILARNATAEQVFPQARVGVRLGDVAPELARLERRASAQRTDPLAPVEFEAALDGRVFRVRLVPMPGPGRRGLLGELLLLTDVTEQRAYERRILELNRELQRSVVELEAATEAKDRFIANMSHELRTPLQSIIGYAGMLARGVSGPINEEQAENVEVILNSARHLHSLIDSLLDLSKLKAGTLEVNPEPVEACEIAAAVIQAMQPLAERKQLEMRAVCGATRFDIYTDPVKLRQILLNLVGNAVKFTEAGSVVLDVRSVGDSVRFSVMDTGPGVPADQRDLIFEPFHQVAHTFNRKPQGAGLGLYLSKVLAELLGGTLTLERTSPRGSTFTLLLPVTAPRRGPVETTW